MNKALDDAESAQLALKVVQNTLGSARSWNTYDAFFGGGLLADVEEHSRLDQAAREAANADQRMSVLRTELTDLDHTAATSPLISIGNATRFVDFGLATFSPTLRYATGSPRASRMWPTACKWSATSSDN